MEYFIQILFYIKYLHDINIFHGDINIKNFLITKNKEIKILNMLSSDYLYDKDSAISSYSGYIKTKSPEVFKNNIYNRNHYLNKSL